MVGYTTPPVQTIESNGFKVNSFLMQKESNIDWRTVSAFGDEWQKFASINDADLQRIGADYFDLVDNRILPKDALVLDAGCGNGRWARYLADRVRFIEAIDPSAAVFSAARMLAGVPNTRVTQSDIDMLPFPGESFDFIYSLGVLHHIPNTQRALLKCCEKLKRGGWLLIYLYYNLENRGTIYRALFRVANVLRLMIAPSPGPLKRFVCDALTCLLYLPLAFLGKAAACISPTLASKLPLSYYRNTSFSVMRNDALDRFGTPLEKRFSKEAIWEMMTACGLKNIQFSDREPYWHVVAQKP